MSELQFYIPEKIDLKSHPDYNEKWLQERIADDPTILGLGELVLIDRERRQEKAGRLDLLFADVQEQSRYEVELMLGRTDESHIIRCIEYWDIERRRFPGHDHYAVLIAEDVTTRFLNILGLFVGTIPLICIQLNAIRVDNKIILNFVKVIDKTELRRDDSTEKQLTSTDRAYWLNKAGNTAMDIADQILAKVLSFSNKRLELQYNKYYIAISEETSFYNFMSIRPRKDFLYLHVTVEDVDLWVSKLEDFGLAASDEKRGRMNLKVKVGKQDFNKKEAALGELLKSACEHSFGDTAL